MPSLSSPSPFAFVTACLRPRTTARRAAVLLVALTFALALFGCGRRIGEGNDNGSDTSASTSAPASPGSPGSPSSPATAAARPATSTGESWNASQIDWQPYEAGLQRAKAQHKPVCLVFSTTWCPHCKNFSHVFDDPRVVARAHDFVMIHLDADVEENIASKYALDGSYIPRTFFLKPDGTLDDTIHAQRARSRFFYDEHDPGPLLAAMETARQRLIN
jgi:thiol:disulfide interchange protein